MRAGELVVLSTAHNFDTPNRWGRSVGGPHSFGWLPVVLVARLYPEVQVKRFPLPRLAAPDVGSHNGKLIFALLV